MRFFVALILSLCYATAAHAGIVVWLEDEVPGEKSTTKADNRTGGTRHLGAEVLRYPPQPVGEDDEAAWEALREAIQSGEARWEDFEVEFGIASTLEERLDALDVVRGERDVELLLEALLLQGAAIRVAFEDEPFKTEERAEPFRYTRVGGMGNRPWGDAYAIDPDRKPLRSDVADGATFPDLQKEFDGLPDRERGQLEVPELPPGAVLYLDGGALEGTDAIEVPAGRHFLHVVRDEVVSGRRVVRVDEGETVAYEGYVTTEDLAAARARVLEETTTGFPEDVKKALEKVAAHYGGPIFVGAEESGRTVVLPYAYGASLLKQRRVTFLTTGEIGGGIMSTQLFDQSEGNQAIAPLAMGSLGFELGIYNAAIVAGTDLAMTPGFTITHAKGDSTEENVDTSLYVHPYVGAGVYLLRPTGRSTTALISGHYSWHHPSHHAVGGRFSLGIPFEPEGGTWLKLTVGGSGFPSSMWDEGSDRTSMVLLYARSGVATRF